MSSLFVNADLHSAGESSGQEDNVRETKEKRHSPVRRLALQYAHGEMTREEYLAARRALLSALAQGRRAPEIVDNKGARHADDGRPFITAGLVGSSLLVIGLILLALFLLA